MEWINAKKNPKCNVKFGDSDYFLCVDMNTYIPPFIGWYNNKEKVWKVAHHYANSSPVTVTQYIPLPELPENNNQ